MEQWLHAFISRYPELYRSMLHTELGARCGTNPIHRESSLWAHGVLAARQSRVPLISIAALLHDIGKIATGKTEHDRRVFPGHASVGALIVLALAEDCPTLFEDPIHMAQLVCFHMDPAIGLSKAVYRVRYNDVHLLRDVRDVALSDVWGRISPKQVCQRRVQRVMANADTALHLHEIVTSVKAHLIVYVSYSIPEPRWNTTDHDEHGLVYVSYTCNRDDYAIWSTARWQSCTLIVPRVTLQWIRQPDQIHLFQGARRFAIPSAELIQVEFWEWPTVVEKAISVVSATDSVWWEDRRTSGADQRNWRVSTTPPNATP